MARFINATRRQKRARKIFGGAGAGRSHKLFVAGVKPAACFGCEIDGCSQGQLRKLRRWSFQFRGLPNSCSSSAAIALFGDPSASPATAPAMKWAKEAWRSDVDPRALPSTRLQDIYCRVSRKWPSRRAQAKGPVSLAFLDLSRLKWSWPTAFVWEDDLGYSYDLRTTSPAALQLELAKAARRQQAAHLASKRAAMDTIDPSPILRTMATQATTPQERRS